jgi:isoleucyl-tRNA synthetase
LRWYFFSAGSPWTNRRIDEQAIDESTRRFLVTLWSTYYFFVTYASLDSWEPSASRETSIGRGAPAQTSAHTPAHTATRSPSHVMDRWARSRVHATVSDVTEALDGFDALRAAQALERLVDDLSNWYVRRSRSRFWKSSDPHAHATLHESLATVALLLAPLCPFVADELWGNLGGTGESVHLADWPEVDPTAIDSTLDAAVSAVRQIVTLGRAARADAKIKVRQPLPRALVLLPDGVALSDELAAEIAEELNVKRVETIGDLTGLLDYAVVPNFRRLGPRVGPLMPQVKAALASVSGGDVSESIERDGVFELAVGGETIEIGPEDVEIRAIAHEELVLAEEGGYAVALDIRLDDGLRLEGLARELVRTLNDHRKAIDLALSDRIRVTVFAEDAVADAARIHGDWIAGEVLAVAWTIAPLADAPDDAAALDVDGARITVRVAIA